MGEFERSGLGEKRGVVWAIGDIFTVANFKIAAMAAIIGYISLNFFERILSNDGTACSRVNFFKSNDSYKPSGWHYRP